MHFFLCIKYQIQHLNIDNNPKNYYKLIVVKK